MQTFKIKAIISFIALLVFLNCMNSCATKFKSDINNNSHKKTEAFMLKILNSDQLDPEDKAYLDQKRYLAIYMHEANGEIYGLKVDLMSASKVLESSSDKTKIDEWVKNIKSYISIRKISKEKYSMKINGVIYHLYNGKINKVESYFGI